MYLIYGKNRVGKALAQLCDLQKISYEMRDDSDKNIDFSRYEAIIPSPGIPATHAIYDTGKIISELDFAYQFLPKDFQILAITGTDGKSTTTHILYSILEKYFFGKRKIFISGNFEIPFSQTVTEILQQNLKKGIIVIEISSFMSYFIGKAKLPAFSPDYTIFTNLKVDHLNWHRNLQEYVDAKMNLIHHTKKKSIMNAEILEFVREKNLHISLPDNTRIFSQNYEKTPRDWTDGEKIVISGRKKYTLSQTGFSGVHNALNILSATLVTNEMKICSKKTKIFLTEIEWLAHRLEKISEKNGIIFVDDSKSTSAQSLEAALWAFWQEKNILLIAGGSDKGDVFLHLSDIFQKRVKAVACMGATKKHFSDIAQKNHIPFLETDDMYKAVKWLYDQAKIGEIVMLSSGCASFWLFQDYLDRANTFRDAVSKI